MPIRIAHSLDSVDPTAWNALDGGIDNPFLRHEFLNGLEQHGCVGEHWGWLPRHLLYLDESGVLRGAVPLYEKHNSYGELVFDWAWAEAYERQGLRYYPKLVSAVPYSPVPGPRLLIHREADRAEVTAALVTGALELARAQGHSSLHWLFPHDADLETLRTHGFMARLGTQFHWFNRGYRDFEHFLEGFSAHKRKKLRRERRRVSEQGIEVEVHDGHSAGEAQWEAFTRFYLATFDKHWGYATLNGAFFRHLGQNLPEAVVLVLARHQGRYVAGALSLRSGDALFGRHWGCEEDFHSLHFELCYYRGIDYCIEHGLARFEPGAQGEHKVGRGFEPMPTWSAHWLAEPTFARAVDDFLQREETAMGSYMEQLAEHLPFKKAEE